MMPDHIIGHTSQIAQLLADATHGNVAHAYLFVGPEHVGKMTVAKAFATHLLSQHISPQETEQTVHRINRLIHPDLLVLDVLWTEDGVNDWVEIAQSSNIPQQHRAKAKMKTEVIGIDDVRAIQQRLHETGESSQRVCIIRAAQRMQTPAANALLKMLEEPPAGRTFILTAPSAELVLPTVRSRTRIIQFSTLPATDISSITQGLPPEEAAFVQHLSRGLPGVAMRLSADPDALREEKTLHMAARSVWEASSLHERLTLLAPLHERGGMADRFLLHLGLTLRETGVDLCRGERALSLLATALATNAQRQIQVQRFALECCTKPL